MATAPTPHPGILDQIKQTGSAVMDALRSRYLAGPPQGAPSGGPGSVLDQKNVQLQPLLPPQAPLVPTHVELPQAQSPDPSAAYGTRPGEQRIDTSEMTQPLGSGLSGIKRTK